MRTIFAIGLLAATEAHDPSTPIVLAPGLLRDPGRSFLGTMGPCGEEVLYDRYLDEDEVYHCQLASTIWEFA